ncbi:MAG: alkene reductase [Rhodospirillales bacterium]|nr:alkene reductase [Rhodospirillales bacterium]
MAPSTLYEPYDLGPYTLSNRIVMAPLTRSRAGAGNVPQDINAEYYGQRATAGLIITEASQISPQGCGYPSTPGIHSPEQVKGWIKVTKEVHDRGGRIFLQLWHVGRISHPSLQEDGALPVAPMALQPRGDAFTYQGLKPFVMPRALETGEIPGIVGQYRRAAENALMAGFDGVEVHAANGYLLDQFLRDGTNFRTDGYGGSRRNRSRLLMEVLETVTGIWGGERVGVRLSPLNGFNDISDTDPQATFGHVVEALNRFGLAYLHAVEVDMTGKLGDTFDWQKLRNAFDGPYMANGGYGRERAEQSIDSGPADLVSFGVPFIANPDLPARLAEGATLNKADPETFYGGDSRGYTDYPTLKDKAA